MSYLDSLPRADEYVAYSLFKKLWKLLDRTSSKAHIKGFPQRWKVGIPKCPQQMNGYDCGLYVCQAMRATMLGIPYEVTPASMPGFRKGLLQSLERWQNSAPAENNLELLQANEMFTALTIPGTSIATGKKTKSSQQGIDTMELGEYSLLMFTGALRPFL